MDLEALAVEVRALEGEGFVEPESQAVDGGEGDLMVEGCGSLEETPNCFTTENSGETVCGLRAQERQGVPIALKDVLREETDTTGAEAHGSWGEAVDIFAVPDGGLQVRCGEHVGRCALELRQ
jgi:hypothetical protein